MSHLAAVEIQNMGYVPQDLEWCLKDISLINNFLTKQRTLEMKCILVSYGKLLSV